MYNLRMQEKLQRGEALDVAGRYHEEMNAYEVTDLFVEDVDYCDAQKEYWMWSIGRDLQTGRIWAATDSRFSLNPDYECVWLR